MRATVSGDRSDLQLSTFSMTTTNVGAHWSRGFSPFCTQSKAIFLWCVQSWATSSRKIYYTPKSELSQLKPILRLPALRTPAKKTLKSTTLFRHYLKGAHQVTWLPHNKFVGKSQSCENALANSQRHSSGTSRSAKRPRANHKPQQDEAESRSSRDALGATRRISAGDRRFGSAARVAHARARGLDILQNCHGAKSRGRKKKGQRQEGGNTKEESDAPEGRGSATRAKRRGGGMWCTRSLQTTPVATPRSKPNAKARP